MAIVDLNLTTITNGSIVNDEWSGTGIFDKLIGAVNSNIKLQHTQGRLSDADYATVYLGAMQSAIEQSVNFLLQKEVTAIDILAKRAATEDQYGKAIDDNGNMTDSSSTVTQHYWAVKLAEEKLATAEYETDKTEKEVDATRLENAIRQAKLMIEYNLAPTDTALGESLQEYKDFLTELNSEAAIKEWKETGVPKTLFELQVLAKRVEADVANNTAKGYEADAMYKVYRSLQELMFSLTNAGIVDTSTDSVYKKIVEGMEKAMNGQVGLWGYALGIDLDDDGTTETPVAATPL